VFAATPPTIQGQKSSFTDQQTERGTERERVTERERTKHNLHVLLGVAVDAAVEDVLLFDGRAEHREREREREREGGRERGREREGGRERDTICTCFWVMQPQRTFFCSMGEPNTYKQTHTQREREREREREHIHTICTCFWVLPSMPP
jgi:hypothetical protein